MTAKSVLMRPKGLHSRAHALTCPFPHCYATWLEDCMERKYGSEERL